MHPYGLYLSYVREPWGRDRLYTPGVWDRTWTVDELLALGLIKFPLNIHLCISHPLPGEWETKMLKSFAISLSLPLENSR